MGNHHDHNHSHDDPGHGHEAAGSAILTHVHHASYRKLLISFWIVTLFMLVEIASGWLFNSLTLMSDGFHMLSDAVALGLSAFAVSLGARRATEEKTFGFKRMEILAAFGNGLALILLSSFILVQAIDRLVHPQPVDARPMLWVATLGLIVNLIAAWWLHHGEHEKTLNEESAFLHVLGDLGASLAAITAAGLILWKGWLWTDPVLSILIAGAITVAGIGVMRRSGHILVEGTPEGVEIDSVRKAMLATEQVRSVHDLHVWTMNGRDLYLSAHVDIIGGQATEKQVSAALTRILSREFRMDHITLQVGQCAEDDCLNNCEGPSRSDRARFGSSARSAAAGPSATSSAPPANPA